MQIRTLLQRGFLFFVIAAATIARADGPVLYENNFEKATVGKVPDEFLVQDGQFAVKEENGNKILELPGAPLETYGVLFGPTEATNIQVRASIVSTSKGRRAPAFAVGLNGVGGYRLQVSAAKKVIELSKGDEVVKSIAYDWKSGDWTELMLAVRKVKDSVTIEGKVWEKAAAEPKEWLISFEDKETLAAGKASVWGTPFSGNPIQFDNIKVERIAPIK